jgi:uncharacterized membrane protein YeiH
VSSQPAIFAVLDLSGTFVFALNGALTALRATRLDVVGVIALGMTTALGGGVIRDLCLGYTPPATFQDWRYFALALAGAIIAFLLSRMLGKVRTSILVLDAVGLGVFAVLGASKAIEFGLGVAPALALGVISAVGGGTIRDVMVGQVPTVLRAELYAVPALVAAALTIAAIHLEIYGTASAVGAVAVCFAIRVIGARRRWNAPNPPAYRWERGSES